MSTSACTGWNARENDVISVFMDTGALVGARNSGDNRHKLSVEAIGKAPNGTFGAVYTSDYVVDEAITLALTRTGTPAAAFDIGDFILKSDRIRPLLDGKNRLCCSPGQVRALQREETGLY